MTPFSGSYDPEDAIFLLKPVTLAPTDIAEKEALIQSGKRHYSEMLSAERPPDPRYLELYEQALARNGKRLGLDIATLATALDARAPEGREIVLASLARAGTPIGVLLKRALGRIGRSAVHYSISIIRDRGIDRNALAWIAERHDPADAVFIDGWTGKGAIAGELARSLADRPHGFTPFLAVVADPAGRADLAATDDDYLVASGLLNSVVSGLVSRSVLNDEVVGPGDFHACVFYREFADQDRSRSFIETIDKHVIPAPAKDPFGLSLSKPCSFFCHDEQEDTALRQAQGDREGECSPSSRHQLQTASATLVSHIMAETGTTDRNRIKPGIAEATRAVLRRLPDSLYVRDPDDPDVAHLRYLAGEKGLTLNRLPPGSRYRAVAVIKSLGSE